MLRTDASTARVRGRGTARWRNGDTQVPEICDELAVARALSDLGHRLVEVAGEDIDALGLGVARAAG